MDLNSSLLGDFWPWAHLIYWPLLAWALYRAPWSILTQKDSSNVLFATCVGLFMIWQLRVQVADGLDIHLLGSTLLTLMFRWQTALLANALILLGMTLTSDADLAAFATNGLLMGALPIGISYLVWRLNEWYLPANYFVYIFVVAFLSAGLGMITVGNLSWWLLGHTSGLPMETLDQFRWIFVPIMYPEAFLTGGAISIFVIYKPEWIATFDDRRYLRNR
jgi:uncharacterized membrane protein